METWAQFGFAALVAGFVLVRLDTTIRDQTKAISLLTLVVARMSNQDVSAMAKQFGVGSGD